MTWSGSVTWDRVVPGSPSCLPGFLPERVRRERGAGFFFQGLTAEGGWEEVVESRPRRRLSSALSFLSWAFSRLSSARSASSFSTRASRCCSSAMEEEGAMS